MMKRNFLIVFFLSLILVSPRVLAQSESTPAAEPTADPEIKEKVEQRIQKVLNSQTGEKKAFVGQVSEIDDYLMIETKTGSVEINFDEQTTFVGPEGEKIQADEIVEDEYIIAMGILASTDALEASRVVVIEKPEPLEKVSVFGTVSDTSSDGENILMLKRLKDDEVFEIEVTGKTIINQDQDGEIEKIKFEDINEGGRLIAIGTTENGNDTLLTATLIRVFSGETTATSEATPAVDQD
jgi:hypothetical protein